MAYFIAVPTASEARSLEKELINKQPSNDFSCNYSLMHVGYILGNIDFKQA